MVSSSSYFFRLERMAHSTKANTTAKATMINTSVDPLSRAQMRNFSPGRSGSGLFKS